MASSAQINAALANAQHSTGPRSVEGKAASSKNALKLGLYAHAPILPGEDPEEFAALARSFRGQFRPQTFIEKACLDDLIRCEWLKRRYYRIEAQVIQQRVAALAQDYDPDTALVQVFVQDAEGPRVLEKIHRRQEAVERLYHRALTSLRQAVKNRRLFPQEPPELPLPELHSSFFKNEPDSASTRSESTPAAPPSVSSAAPADNSAIRYPISNPSVSSEGRCSGR
ncbi:MAG TPA: hypothetical protein VMJ75_22055 [Candidatus Acidoferrales bacterium]|nr:hypothetical protein [Candidatus Acidoferrales bacterium]